MEIERLYIRLNHDVFTHFYPDVYLKNQEGDINKFNRVEVLYRWWSCCKKNKRL